MTGQVFMQISRVEAVNLAFGFEEFFGRGCLAILSEVGGADATSFRVGHGFGEGVAFLCVEGGDVHIGAAVQKSKLNVYNKTVIAFDTLLLSCKNVCAVS